MSSSIALLPVDASEAGFMTRDIEVPAHLNGPLFRAMWPTHDTMCPVEREEMMQWYNNILEDALENPGDESFLKACQIDYEGSYGGPSTVVGFCGWEVLDRTTPNHAEQSEQKTDDQITDQKPKEKNTGQNSTRDT